VTPGLLVGISGNGPVILLRRCPLSSDGRASPYPLSLGYPVRYTRLMSEVAELIREARTKAGLTQSELAGLARTSQPTIAAYESGAKVPTAATLERLLRAAGVRLGAVPITTSPSSGIRTLIRKHRDQILDIAARHGATNVRIFGSVARGDSRRGSDLDLLVEMGPRTSLLDQVRLRRALNELLPVDVDVVTKGGLRESDAAIEAESVPL